MSAVLARIKWRTAGQRPKQQATEARPVSEGEEARAITSQPPLP
jgi:hypothetical protein